MSARSVTRKIEKRGGSKPRRIERKRLGEMMSPWGSDFSYGVGSGSIGAVGSYYSSGDPYPDKTYVEHAIAEAEKDIPLAEHGAHGWTKKDAKELRTIAAGLRYYLEHDYSAKKSAHASGGAPEEMIRQYMETALWSSNDESDESGGEPLDKNYSISDIADDTQSEMQADCDRFYTENADKIREGGDVGAAGHDFWLSRNGHGAGFDDGFDDGDWGDVGEALENAAEKFGSYDLYVGDDKQIHGSKG